MSRFRVWRTFALEFVVPAFPVLHPVLSRIVYQIRKFLIHKTICISLTIYNAFLIGEDLPVQARSSREKGESKSVCRGSSSELSLSYMVILRHFFR